MDTANFLIVHTVLLAAAWRMARVLLSAAPRSLQILAGGIGFISMITAWTMLLGVAGILSPQRLHIGVLAMSLLLLIGGRQGEQTCIEAAPTWWRSLRGNSWCWAIAWVCVAQISILLLKVVLLPVSNYDALTYHVPPAVQWYQLGAIPLGYGTLVTRMDSQALGMTCLHYWFFSFHLDDALVDLPQVLWAVLILPFSLAYLRSWQMPFRRAFPLACAVFFLPAVQLQAPAALDHLGLAVASLSCWLFAVHAFKEQSLGAFVYAALACGLLFGYKLSAPLHLAVLLPALALALPGECKAWGQRGVALARRTVQRQFGMPALRALWVSSAGFGFLMLCAGGYWLLRNLLIHGSVQGNYSLETAAGLEGGGMAALGYSAARLFANLRDFPNRVLDLEGHYSADLGFLSGWGGPYALLVIPGLVATIIPGSTPQGKTKRWLPIAAILLMLAYFGVYYTPFNYRLLIASGIALSLYGGACWDYWLSGTKARMLLVPVLLAMMIWSAWITFIPQEMAQASWTWWKRPQTSIARYLAITAQAEPYLALEKLSPAVPLAYLSDEDTWSYILMDSNWKRRLIAVDIAACLEMESPTVARLKPSCLKQLHSRGVELLFGCMLLRCYDLQDTGRKIRPGLYLLDNPPE